MPKSKRDKKVSLTKTAKHGMNWKKKIVTELREAGDTYENIYVFRVFGMRGAGLRELRRSWRDSKLFLGKNKVMAIALGKTVETEQHPGVHQICDRLKGDCGLLFTNRSEKEVNSFFEKFVDKDYARGGTSATETVVLQEGPLEQFPHSMEPHLRSLGLPTALKRGIVTLIKDYTVCEKDQVLNPEQAKILKLLTIPMSEFRLVLDSVWSKPDLFKVLISPESEAIIGEEDDDGDMSVDDDAESD